MDVVARSSELSSSAIAIITLLIIWSVIWKGIALWKSARLSHKKWFIVLLIINSAGILEIFYTFFIANKYSVETIDENMSKEEENKSKEK